MAGKKLWGWFARQPRDMLKNQALLTRLRDFEKDFENGMKYSVTFYVLRDSTKHELTPEWSLTLGSHWRISHLSNLLCNEIMPSCELL